MENVTNVFVAFLVAAIPIALLAQRAVAVVRGLVDKNATLPGWTWIVAAFVIGVGVCLGWQLNLAATLSHSIPALTEDTHLDGVAGQVLTGLAVGAMAGFWNDKIEQWKAAAAANRTQAGQ